MLPIEMEEGPLWNTLKQQLYRSEVSHIKRLVGESLIHQNKMMWDEVASLRQIFTDFQEQNERLSEGLKHQSQFCGSQHRDLLRRQAQMLLEDVRQQAESCGHVLEDLLPEAQDPGMRDYCLQNQFRRSSSKGDESMYSMPPTPSTRPSTSSGCSSHCGTPEPGLGLAQLPLGRHLGVDELVTVADSIREALEAEHESLLSAIGEEMQRFDAEDARRVESVSRREPSTGELQQYVHKLQDLLVSPTLRTLCLTGPPSPSSGGGHARLPTDQSADGREAGGGGGAECVQPVPISGGASVRRLKALISQRRRFAPPGSQGSPSPFGGSRTLGALPETPPAEAAVARLAVASGSLPGAAVETGSVSATDGGVKAPAFDPFWDDPFA